MKQARVVICRSNPVMPDPRVEKIARALAGAGYAVQVIGWDRSGELPLQADLYDAAAPIPISRLSIVGAFGHGLGNLPSLLRWQVGLLTWLVRNRSSYDVIHACDFDTVLPAGLCRMLWGKKLIYDIFDFYADHLRATPGVIKGIIRRVDLFMAGTADAVILVDEARREQMVGAQLKRVEIIFNSPEELPQAENHPLPQAAPGGLRLVYVGLLQVERGLLELLAVLKEHPEWELDLAGFGGDEHQIVAAARQLPSVRWHGRISYEQALVLSQDAHVMIATYDPAIPNHRYSSPNKVFEAMLLGKPIIVARGTNMDRMIEQANCGLVVDYGDTRQLVDAFQSLASDESLRTRLGDNGRLAYAQLYSWAIMKTRLGRLYQEVTGLIA